MEAEEEKRQEHRSKSSSASTLFNDQEGKFDAEGRDWKTRGEHERSKGGRGKKMIAEKK